FIWRLVHSLLHVLRWIGWGLPMYAHAIFAAVFIWLVVFAIIIDTCKLTIPNWISIALVAGFFGFAIVGSKDTSIWQHLLIGSAVLLGSGVLFHLRWMGGGDVKLLSAVALWAGPSQILPLLLLVTLLGAGLALAMLYTHLWMLGNSGTRQVAVAKRFIP